MNLLDVVQFARPGWLWALLALPLIAALWWSRRSDVDAWRQAVDPHLLAQLIDTRPQARSWAGLVLALLVGLLAVLALAGPGWREIEVPLRASSGTPLVVAIDLSSRVNASDLPPSRLMQARAKLAQLLARREGGPVALVAYADDAFTVAPLTEDAANVALYIDALSADVMPVDGQRAERAITHAAGLLRQAGATRGDILLLTGQADAEAAIEAGVAARMGYRVSVLGVGTERGAAYRDADGRLAHARLESTQLRTLAAAGNGEYHALTADATDLEALDVLKPQAVGEQPDSTDEATTRRRLDEGYWLILPMLLLLLPAFRRGSALFCLLVFAGLPLAMPAHAAPPEAGLWQRADQVAHARMEAGNAAYRAGRYDEALEAWDGLPGADAAYNRGNALAKLGRLDDAISAYDQALAEHAGMEDAEANRAAVEAARQRQSPSGGGGSDRPDNGGDSASDADEGAGDESKRKDADAGSPAASGDEDGEQAGEQVGGQPDDADDDQDRAGDNAGDRQDPQAGHGEERDTGAPPPDAQAQQADQRQADQDQREQMQQALDARQEGASESRGQAQSEAEARADAERRQANAAWLQQVPDDPGALLRARFQLERLQRARGDTRR